VWSTSALSCYSASMLHKEAVYLFSVARDETVYSDNDASGQLCREAREIGYPVDVILRAQAERNKREGCSQQTGPWRYLHGCCLGGGCCR
jgi:hypothetical protein